MLNVKQDELLNIRIEEQLKEREEEKRYYLKHNFLTGIEAGSYLNLNTENWEFFLGSKEEAGSIKTTFTEEEIDNFEQGVFSAEEFTKEAAY